MCTLVPFADRLICTKCLKFSLPPAKPNPFICCDQKMQIEFDTSALCLHCGKIIFNAIPCATTEQFYANGGRRKSLYKQLGYKPVFFDGETMKKIKDNLNEPAVQGLKKTLKKLKLGRYESVSYLLSEITGEKIPDVSEGSLLVAEQMFFRLEKKIFYYPDEIYKIFYKINPTHPLLKWIPRKCKTGLC